MTDNEIKAARAVIANVMLQTGPNVFGSAAWFRDKATTLAKTLEVALAEIERMRPVYEVALKARFDNGEWNHDFVAAVDVALNDEANPVVTT
jgi:hypothetical protein